MTEPTYTQADLQTAVAAALEEVDALCKRVASGYAAGGDHAISTGILLTSGNIRALITPDTSAALAARDARMRREGMERAADAMLEAMRLKLQMWEDDDGLRDWVAPGKTLIAEAAAISADMEGE